MSVKIRLRRMGARGKPFYRLVVADSRSPRSGRFIEIIGNYDPRTDPPTINLDEEKALKWLSCGAQPTDTTRALLKKQGVMGKFLAPKPAKKAKSPAKAAEEAPAAPAEAVEVVEAKAEVVEAVEPAEVAEAAPEAAVEKKKPATRTRKAAEKTTTATTKKRTAKPKAEESAPAAEPEAAAEEQPTEEQG